MIPKQKTIPKTPTQRAPAFCWTRGFLGYWKTAKDTIQTKPRAQTDLTAKIDVALQILIGTIKIYIEYKNKKNK